MHESARLAWPIGAIRVSHRCRLFVPFAPLSRYRTGVMIGRNGGECFADADGVCEERVAELPADPADG